MEIGKVLMGAVVGVSLVAAAPRAWAVGPVTVPNFSFESPEVNNPFNATATLDIWQKSAIPDYAEASGTFKNVDQGDPDSLPDIDNTDGIQGAFLFSAPANEIYQDLLATYQVGEAYQLTVGAEGGGLGMVLGEPLLMILYYRDPTIQSGDNRVPINFATILNDNPPNQTITHLDDWSVSIPQVAANDPWAGKAIGIQFAAPLTATGGYWDLDNVRLTAFVPEPTAIGLLAFASLGLLRRRT